MPTNGNAAVDGDESPEACLAQVNISPTYPLLIPTHIFTGVQRYRRVCTPPPHLTTSVNAWSSYLSDN